MIVIVMEERTEAENDYVLPEKWCMQIKGHEEVVKEYLMSIPDFDKDFEGETYGYLLSTPLFNDHSYMFWGHIIGILGYYTEITFEQFKKYVLKEEQPMEKELIGYRLKDQKYEKAAVEICKANNSVEIHDFKADYSFDIAITHDCRAKEWLESAGVLDLWFEPVYKEKPKEQPFKKGDWVIGEYDGSDRTNTYIGIYDSKLLMSEWADVRYNDEWASSTGMFTRITRLATPEEISIAKTYKYATQIKEIRNKADKEIEALLK